MLRSTALITLALAFAAPAAAEAPLKGSYEGQAFEYSTRQGANDTVLIEGRLVQGDRFSFTVRPSGRVVGEVGNTAVNFTVSKASRDQLAKSVRARTQVAQIASFSAGSN